MILFWASFQCCETTPWNVHIHNEINWTHCVLQTYCFLPHEWDNWHRKSQPSNTKLNLNQINCPPPCFHLEVFTLYSTSTGGMRSGQRFTAAPSPIKEGHNAACAACWPLQRGIVLFLKHHSRRLIKLFYFSENKYADLKSPRRSRASFRAEKIVS